MSNLTFVTGNLFESTLPAIGQGVNIYGVMGSGIAPIIRKLYPAVYPPYRAACVAHTLLPGQMLPVEVEPEFWVFNLSSQDKPGAHARLEWFETSLVETFEFSRANGIEGFAIPRIGAGIGGLKWKDVKTVIEHVAIDYPDVLIEAISQPGAPD